jgi:hypothetical protein
MPKMNPEERGAFIAGQNLRPRADYKIVAYGTPATRGGQPISKRLPNPNWHRIEKGARYPTDADIRKSTYVTIHTTSGNQQGYWNIAVEAFKTIADVEEYLEDVIAEEYA